MGGRTVCPGDGEPVFDGIAGRRIVVGIVDLLVYDGLDRGILRRVDRESAGVQHVVSLGIGVAKLFLHGILYLFYQLVRKIAVRGGSLLGDDLHVLNSGIYVVRQRFLLFVLGDVPLIDHVLQDDLLLVRVGLLSGYRIEL